MELLSVLPVRVPVADQMAPPPLETGYPAETTRFDEHLAVAAETPTATSEGARPAEQQSSRPAQAVQEDRAATGDASNPGAATPGLRAAAKAQTTPEESAVAADEPAGTPLPSHVESGQPAAGAVKPKSGPARPLDADCDESIPAAEEPDVAVPDEGRGSDVPAVHAAAAAVAAVEQPQTLAPGADEQAGPAAALPVDAPAPPGGVRAETPAPQSHWPSELSAAAAPPGGANPSAPAVSVPGAIGTAPQSLNSPAAAAAEVVVDPAATSAATVGGGGTPIDGAPPVVRPVGQSAAGDLPLPQVASPGANAPAPPATDDSGDRSPAQEKNSDSALAQRKSEKSARSRGEQGVRLAEEAAGSGAAPRAALASAAAVEAPPPAVVPPTEAGTQSAPATASAAVPPQTPAASAPANGIQPAAERPLSAAPAALRPQAERSGEQVAVHVVDRARFVQRVGKAMQVAADRGGPLRLRLSPPELGALRLEITLRNGQMQARVEATTETARQALLENLPLLRERLAEQNIRLDRFEVDLQAQADGQQRRQAETGEQSGTPRRGAWQRPAAREPAPLEAPPERSVRGPADGRLNIVV